MIEKGSYLVTLRRRTAKNRAYQKHQAVGADIAELLRDPKHTALYIKLAKERDEQLLRALARAAAENPNVRNPGAYFMRLLYPSAKLGTSGPSASAVSSTEKQTNIRRKRPRTIRITRP